MLLCCSPAATSHVLTNQLAEATVIETHDNYRHKEHSHLSTPTYCIPILLFFQNVATGIKESVCRPQISAQSHALYSLSPVKEGMLLYFRATVAVTLMPSLFLHTGEINEERANQ